MAGNRGEIKDDVGSLVVMTVTNLEKQPTAGDKLAAELLDTLSGRGNVHVVVSPGGRSAALAMAVGHHPKVKSTVILDERSAGFFALGFAKNAPDTFVCLLCTSGSAGAHYLPALIEADYSGVPLFVITADRPERLRFSGASQTINQVNYFGHHVGTAACISDEPDAASTRRDVLHALLASMDALQGPVHLNVCLDEPLSQQTQALEGLQNPIAQKEPRRNDGQTLDGWHKWVTGVKMGAVILGPDSIRSSEETIELKRLLNQLQWPCFTSASAGMNIDTEWITPVRFESCLLHDKEFLDTFDGFLYLGQAPTARRVTEFFAGRPSETPCESMVWFICVSRIVGIDAQTAQ